MIDLEEVIHYLQNRDYCVEAKTVDNTVLVNIPQRVIHPITEHSVVMYTFDDNSINITASGVQSTITTSNTIQVPNYARRPYVIYHIYKNCVNTSYHFELVNWQDKNSQHISVGEFFVNMPAPPEPELQKEAMLSAVIMSAFNAKFEDIDTEYLKTHDIEVGFNLIKGMLAHNNVI